MLTAACRGALGCWFCCRRRLCTIQVLLLDQDGSHGVRTCKCQVTLPHFLWLAVSRHTFAAHTVDQSSFFPNSCHPPGNQS